jgi:hypothetical protein
VLYSIKWQTGQTIVGTIFTAGTTLFCNEGTSVHFLTSPLLSYSPPVHMYPPPSAVDHLQGLHRKANNFHTLWPDDFLDVNSPKVNNFCSPLLLGPEQHRMSHGCIRTDLCDTTTPSTSTWTPIYGRLGTVTLCISFVDWPSQGSLEYSLWISLG